METTRSRNQGQCSMELVVIVALLTTFLLTYGEFFSRTRDFLAPAFLSREARP